MLQLSNLHEFIEYERSFEILRLNGSYLNCTIAKNLTNTAMVTRSVFQYLGPIMLILGVIGNSLGLYCAMNDKIIYIRVYLTRVFHAVNLVNYIFMFLYPVLDMIAEFHLVGFVSRFPWNLYMANYHFPMAKTLVNFSFGIYVIFGISQMTAITYPHFYKNHFTLHKIKIMLVVCFLYFFALYVPSGWWFDLLELRNICGFDSKLIIYTRVFATYTNKERKGWLIFGFFREVFTRFIPVASILVLNYFFLKNKKSNLTWRSKQIVSNLQESTSVTINRAVLLPEFGYKKRGLSDRNKETSELSKVNSSIITGGKYDVDKNNKCTENTLEISKVVSTKASSSAYSKPDSKADLESRRKIKQRVLEYKLSIRMLAILFVEFLIFLFPVSIYLMVVDFFENILTTEESNIVFAACTLLEYAYISLTFYLNMIFNPAYRQDFNRVIKKSRLGHYYNRRKNSVSFET
ncbi:unnamed protein product [Gordionus sp. m RMFG-2023]